MQIRELTTTTTLTSVRSEQYIYFIHTRTSPPWLQHRGLNLCHDLSHYLFQTCLVHNSALHTAPHPTNARDTFSTVSPSSDHIELLRHRDSRLCHGSQSKTAGWGPTTSDCRAQFHEVLFRCTTRIMLCCLNFGIRDRQKTSQALSSRRHPLWSVLRRGPGGCDRDSTAWISTSSHRHL